MHTFCLYYIFVLSCLCLVCLSSILFFPFQIELNYSCQVGMWQIELINFFHLSTHLFSQPTNVYWTLGVGNVQGSRASKMKLRCFSITVQRENTFLCTHKQDVLFWGPQNLIYNYSLGEQLLSGLHDSLTLSLILFCLHSVIWPPGCQELRHRHC